MKTLQILLVIVISVATTIAASYFISPKGQPSPVAESVAVEKAYDRVMKTGVLRCGYYVFPPVIIRDLKTSQLSGLSVDMMERMLKTAGIKIEWVEEVDFGNWMLGLKAGRFDALCTPMWPEVAMAREVMFTRSMFYAGVNVYARGDDHRFDGNIESINDPKFTIVAIEGTSTQQLTETYFPKAKMILLPQSSPGGSMAENVVSKKADVLLWDVNGVHDFLKYNPNSLHNVDNTRSVRVMPFELVVNSGEYKLLNLLNTGLQTLEDTGYTNILLDKWERDPNSFYRMAKPYVMNNK